MSRSSLIPHRDIDKITVPLPCGKGGAGYASTTEGSV